MKNPIEIIRRDHPEFFIPTECAYPKRVAPQVAYSFLLVDLVNKCFYFGKRPAFCRAIRPGSSSVYAIEYFKQLEASGNFDCFAQFYGEVTMVQIDPYLKGFSKMTVFHHGGRTGCRESGQLLFEYTHTPTGAVFYASSAQENVKATPKIRAKQALLKMAKCVNDADAMVKIYHAIDEFDVSDIRVKVSDLSKEVRVAAHVRNLNKQAAKNFEELVANS